MGLVLFFAAACFTRLSAQGVTTISNGGFEVPYDPGLQMGAGSTNLPGWTVEGTGLPVTLVTTGPYGNSPYQGQQFLLFDAQSASGVPSDSISQTISTTVGSPCTVTYALLLPDGGVFEASAAASDGTVLSTNNYKVPGSETNDWALYQLFFTATTTNTTLTFVDLSGTAADEPNALPMGLDDVTIVALIPAPTITEALSNQTVGVGTVVTFSASATAAGPMTIQWYYETTAIQGATNTFLTVTAAESAVGVYTATFTDVGGSNSTSCLLKLGNTILINGGFEAPVVTSGEAHPVSQGETLLPGWIIDSGIVLLINYAPSAYEGQQFIAFNDAGMSFQGSLSQTFQTTVGQSYTVSFAVGGWSDSDGISLGVTVAAADSTILSASNCVAPFSGWLVYQVPFAATTPNTTLTFTDGSEGAGTLDLDGVVVAPSIPTLNISTGSGGIVLSWQTTGESFQLETTASLDTTWVMYPGTLVTNSGIVAVTVPLSPTNSFFRLATY
jgi:hypothetical protein